MPATRMFTIRMPAVNVAIAAILEPGSMYGIEKSNNTRSTTLSEKNPFHGE
jgi:hypothetical protein